MRWANTRSHTRSVTEGVVAEISREVLKTTALPSLAIDAISHIYSPVSCSVGNSQVISR